MSVRNREQPNLKSLVRFMPEKLRNSPAWLNLLYVPALLLFGLFILYPFIRGLMYSFTNWDGYSQTFKWIGLSNYRRMFSDPDVARVIRNTFIYGLGSALLQNIIGLAYALFLNQNIRMRALTRTIIYLPAIISPLIMGYIWYFFFQYNGGAINDIILLFADEPVNLLGDPDTNVWMITIVNTYQFLGVAMVILLAGLQVIPKEFHEAATIDGAGTLSRFRHVTWPLLAPAVTVSVVLNVIGGLKLFDVITAMTNSGPGYSSASLSTLMYQLYFGRQDAGYAATIGNLMFVIISVVSFTFLFYLKRRETSLA
ncbi:Sugar ABC superfamily ATP binding cassette transporter, membrane protein [Thermobacillus xylanilyticus]|uniref:Sugar ABC superfamily ATP binding cassette transporter, membrane protein n=2 Tax=Thermobacillus xylanilyticus TaxID=76633 RepID=A0ABM8V773_THEXY|nr:sugar ABC transporter permease [Thermobacillus xylanilyticus]CAG5090399.1 Sugar ABC superfamily ATP binding cassette transporter, membrane protein [Thermobacillus xylanilyticus]